MQKHPETFNIADNVDFVSIKDDRFKTVKMSMYMFMPLDKSTASANAILPHILVRSCEKFPDFSKLNEQLENLYGAMIDSDVEKIGESQALSMSATFLDDRYSLDKQSISEQVTQLICEMLFHPKLIDKKFCEDDINQEKRQLLESIDAEYNDKKIYAKQQCIRAMCANETFGVHPLGEKAQIKNLTAEDIVTAWQDILHHARVKIIMIGNIDPTLVINTFKKAFASVKREHTDIKTKFITKATGDVKRFTDTDKLNQSKLVLGLRAGMQHADDNLPAIRIMTALLGGTPHSKLFKNVREKLSLCYYCASRADRNKGIILIESGVKQENIQVAEKEILNQLHEIQNGNFTDEEIANTKLSLCNGFRTISDHLGALENFYILQTFSEKINTPEEIVESLQKVTREQITEAANKVTLDTVYALTNKE